MKDNQMQGPMPSKPALIVKIALQQVTMTKCPMSRFGTTTNVPSIQNQHLCGYPIYVLKRTTTTIGQKNKSRYKLIIEGLANEKESKIRRPQWIQTLSTCYQRTCQARFPSSNGVEMQSTIRESGIEIAK